MRILALETSATGGSVAALQEEHLLWQTQLPEGLKTAQTLLPGIHGLLGRVGWQPAEVELVAVTQGPGSFTGLRVGITAAKTLAYATGAQVLGVDTLEVIASQVEAPAEFVWAILDAQRTQLYAACYRIVPQIGCHALHAAQIVDLDPWLEALQGGMLVSGPPLARIAARLPAEVRQAPPNLWHPQAAGVGRVAWRNYLAGRRCSMWSLAPRYLRASAAEEKAQVRE